MDDQQRETLSAMMDDQADDGAVHQVLSQALGKSVRDQWYRWHQLRDLLRSTSGAAGRGNPGINVIGAVRDVLDQDGTGMEQGSGNRLNGRTDNND